MAYEWLSRNAKSGYFVLNFDTQSVKLGFKNWLKKAPIFPISGGPVTFRPSLVGGVGKNNGKAHRIKLSVKTMTFGPQHPTQQQKRMMEESRKAKDK